MKDVANSIPQVVVESRTPAFCLAAVKRLSLLAQYRWWATCLLASTTVMGVVLCFFIGVLSPANAAIILIIGVILSHPVGEITGFAWCSRGLVRPEEVDIARSFLDDSADSMSVAIAYYPELSRLWLRQLSDSMDNDIAQRARSIMNSAEFDIRN